eukprot:1713648-Pleurochrysis_carterae.AAC.2
MLASAAAQVIKFCTSTSGCRRAMILEHFGETLRRAPHPDCCDLCADPGAAAAAAARVALSGVGFATSIGTSALVHSEDGARKRSRHDKHDTGLVESSGESDCEAVQSSAAAAKQLAIASERRQMAAAQRVLANSQGGRKQSIASRLEKLEDLEEKSSSRKSTVRDRFR